MNREDGANLIAMSQLNDTLLLTMFAYLLISRGMLV